MSLVPAKCTQCGANIKVDSTKEASVCEYCRTPFIVEKAINNYNNNISINNATINIQGLNTENLLKRALSYEKDGDFEKAEEYYDKVLDIDINNIEATDGLKRISSFGYIGDMEISREQADKIDNLIKNRKLIAAIKEVRTITNADLTWSKNFVDNHKIGNWKKGDSVPSNSVQQNSGGCYVATSVYGSYDCPEVWTLRRFRDNKLALSWYGRTFIHVYYAISPKLVSLFGNTVFFKVLNKRILDRMVKRLNIKGYDSSPYIDKKW